MTISILWFPSHSTHILSSSHSKISDTISGLQLSVSGPLTSMEELFTGSKPFLASTRNCRRLSENVINLLSSISLARLRVDAGLGNDSIIGGAIIPLTPVPPSVAPTMVPTGGLVPSPFSPGWAANTLMVNEDYRWGCSPDVHPNSRYRFISWIFINRLYQVLPGSVFQMIQYLDAWPARKYKYDTHIYFGMIPYF